MARPISILALVQHACKSAEAKCCTATSVCKPQGQRSSGQGRPGWRMQKMIVAERPRWRAWADLASTHLIGWLRFTGQFTVELEKNCAF